LGGIRLTPLSPEKNAANEATFLAHANDGWTPEAKANYLHGLEMSTSQPASQSQQRYLDRLMSEFSREETTKSNE
jgi:hypothetical protein